jgi:acyl carrier protein
MGPFNERAGRAMTKQELTRRVLEILRDDILSAADGFDERSNLIEAGLDSLSLTQLLLAIEESVGVWVDESLLTPEHLECAATLAELVHAQLPPD